MFVLLDLVLLLSDHATILFSNSSTCILPDSSSLIQKQKNAICIYLTSLLFYSPYLLSALPASFFFFFFFFFPFFLPPLTTWLVIFHNIHKPLEFTKKKITDTEERKLPGKAIMTKKEPIQSSRYYSTTGPASRESPAFPLSKTVFLVLSSPSNIDECERDGS